MSQVYIPLPGLPAVALSHATDAQGVRAGNGEEAVLVYGFSQGSLLCLFPGGQIKVLSSTFVRFDVPRKLKEKQAEVELLRQKGTRDPNSFGNRTKF